MAFGVYLNTMSFIFLIIIALTGAALLGFATAWYGQKQAIDQAMREKAEAIKKQAEFQATITSLETKASTHQLTIDSIQKQNLTAENEVIKLQTELRVMEGEMQVLAREKRNLQIENTQLTDDQKNNINEIEIIREIPEYEIENAQKSEEEKLDLEKRIENAKRLVNAFKKGVSENSNTTAE